MSSTRHKVILLAATLLAAPGCDDSPKVNACVMAFDQTLSCHYGKQYEVCSITCDELYDVCRDYDPETPACGVTYSECKDRCFDFAPDDPTVGGAHPERTKDFYRLEACTTPEEQEMICSDLTAP